MRSEIPLGACSLDDEELAVRAARWRREVGPAVIERHTIEGGLLTRLEARPDTEASLRKLVRLEAECCPHLGFDISRRRGELHLTVRFT